MWNHEVKGDNIPNGVSLSYRREVYEWKELVGFARNLNTIHGLILHINNFLKSGDNLTRDNQTVQGCINIMNDIINKIDTLKPNHFIAVDEYGRMTSMQPIGDNWINIEINNNNNDQIAIKHKPSTLSANTYKSSDTTRSGFGDSFKILNYTTDTAGHLIASGENTITIPKGSLTDKVVESDSNVVTAIGFTDTTGEITVDREDIANLKLNSYNKDSNANDIISSDTLGSALSKLQTQIHNEESARAAAINNLDVEADTTTTHFISTIS